MRAICYVLAGVLWIALWYGVSALIVVVARRGW